jgi:hypothetical protein
VVQAPGTGLHQSINPGRVPEAFWDYEGPVELRQARWHVAHMLPGETDWDGAIARHRAMEAARRIYLETHDLVDRNGRLRPLVDA